VFAKRKLFEILSRKNEMLFVRFCFLERQDLFTLCIYGKIFGFIA